MDFPAVLITVIPTKTAASYEKAFCKSNESEKLMCSRFIKGRRIRANFFELALKLIEDLQSFRKGLVASLSS